MIAPIKGSTPVSRRNSVYVREPKLSTERPHATAQLCQSLSRACASHLVCGLILDISHARVRLKCWVGVIPPNDNKPPSREHLPGTQLGRRVHLALDACAEAAARVRSDDAESAAIRIVYAAEETDYLGVSEVRVEIHDELR